jgi:hypothetical protein
MKNTNSICYFFLVCGFLFASVANGQNNKNGLRHNVTPLFDLRPTITKEEREAQKGVVRSYLWSLWKTRTAGSFAVRYYSREGNPTNCQYSVALDKAGTWKVSSKCKESICPFISKARCREYLKEYTSNYDSVERKEIGYSEPAAAPSVPDDQKRSPVDYMLILRDSKSGRTVQLK